MNIGIRKSDGLIHVITKFSQGGDWCKLACRPITCLTSDFDVATGETTITENRDDLVITGAMCPECAKEIREFIDEIRMKMAQVQTDIFTPNAHMS